MATAGGVYAIVNRENEKMYIGSTSYFTKRWATHRRLLSRSQHHSPILQASYNKHGKEAFSLEIVEYVDDRSKLIEREQIWLNLFKPAFNIATFAGKSPLGRKASAETRAKMSASQLKRTDDRRWSMESRLNQSRSKLLNPQIVTQETRDKLSAIGKLQKGIPRRKASEETKAKLKEARKNISVGTRMKLSAASTAAWAARKAARGNCG